MKAPSNERPGFISKLFGSNKPCVIRSVACEGDGWRFVFMILVFAFCLGLVLFAHGGALL